MRPLVIPGDRAHNPSAAGNISWHGFTRNACLVPRLWSYGPLCQENRSRCDCGLWVPRKPWEYDANTATPLQHVSCARVVRDCRLVIQNTIKPWRERFLTQSLPPLTYRTICPSWVATDRFGTCKTIIQSRLASQQPSAQPPSAGSRPWPHPQGALILGSTSSSFAEVCRSWQPSPSADPHSREEQTLSGNEEGRLVLARCVIASGGSFCWITATGLRVTVKLTDLRCT